MSRDAKKLSFFTGEFRHGLDPKNRVTIPATWRSGESEDFYVRADPKEGCLQVFPPEEFHKVIENARALDSVSIRERERFVNQFSAGAMLCTADKQGRMVLPTELCQRVNLSGDVVLVGSFSRFEVWNPERWAETKVADSEIFLNVADQLGL